MNDLASKVIDKLATVATDVKWLRENAEKDQKQIRENTKGITANKESVVDIKSNWKVLATLLTIFVIVIQIAVRIPW